MVTSRPKREPKGWLTKVILRNFSPDEYCRSVLDIDLKRLKEEGVKALLIDLDNTLLPWYSYKFRDEIKAWIRSAKEMGFKICIVSNGLHFRVKKLSEELNLPFVSRAVKPRVRGIKQALEILGVEPHEAIIIGDQIFTDIWAANKMGLRSILVKPMGRWEFITTYFIRFVESGLIKWMQRRGFLNKLE